MAIVGHAGERCAWRSQRTASDEVTQVSGEAEAQVQGLFEAVREAASRSAWSRGVELARSGAVVGEREEAEAILLKIAASGALTAHAVVLHPADEDWSCDCGTSEDCCEHVAAAVIAVKRARQAGEALPRASGALASIRYQLKRVEGGLHFERAFVQGERVEPFNANLSAISSGRAKGPAFVASSCDLELELVLGMNLNGYLPRELMVRLCDALAECADVRLDGEPVRASRQRATLHLLLEDRGAALSLRAVQDPSVLETFSNGLALCKGEEGGLELRVLAEPRLNARELQEYREGKSITPELLVEFATKTLPELRERVPVLVRTKRLPRLTEARPRAFIDARREGDALSVLATIVYGDPPIARVDGPRLLLFDTKMPLRDEPSEERIARALQSRLSLVAGHRERFEGERAVAFARKLEAWQGEVVGGGTRDFYVAPGLVPNLRVGGALGPLGFELDFESVEGDVGGGTGRTVGHADPRAVMRAYRAGASLVPLLEGGFAPLPMAWLAEHGERLADLLAAKEGTEGKAELPACAALDLAKLCEALERPPPAGFAELEPLLRGYEGLPAAALPETLAESGIELRPYQSRGVDWLTFLRRGKLGGLLADDMGLGKTLQALCALEPPALVVAPTSVIYNWAAEAARFRPDLSVNLFHGPGRKLDPKAALTLTSYALLRLDLERLAAREWRCVVLDEAQAIKNPESQVARAAYRLRGEWRLALTGTPVENRLEELWSQFHFINPGLLGGRGDFEERYAGPIAQGEAGAAARLRDRIKPFLLRRLKRDVAPELPPRTECVHYCELSETERALYDGVYAATREEVVAKLSAGGSVLAALEALLRLRQAACHGALLPGQREEEFPTSAKLEVLLESLEEAAADGHRSLIFSQWTKLLDLVEPHLRREGIAFERLDGSTVDRAGVVARFQSESGPPVMLISLKAGGAGLNLTAADHVFLLDPWWNPAVEDQAADRTHRIGQERPVFVHRLVSRGTVEERILLLQQAKRELAEAALSGGAAAATLTRDDLLALLE